MQDDEGGHAVDAADADGGAHPLPDPRQAVCAEVLAGVGGHGGADALEGDGQDLPGLAAGGHGGHRRAAQAVDGGLQHDGAHRRDAALQAHRQAHHAQVGAEGGAEAPFLPAPAQHPKVFGHVSKAPHPGHGLADDGGQRRAEHPGVKGQDEKDVQEDVQHAGHDQKVKGAAAVPQRPHIRAGDVVQQGEGDAGKDGADVHVGHVDDVGGGVGQHQDGPGQGHRRRRQHRPEQQGQPDRVGGVAAHPLAVPGAEAAGQRDGKAAGDAVHKAQHQVAQAAHAAHGSQRLHPDKAAHDDGVGHVVKLLEQAAQHQRHREQQDQLQRLALGHVFGHKRIPPLDTTSLSREKRPAPQGGRTLFRTVTL